MISIYLENKLKTELTIDKTILKIIAQIKPSTLKPGKKLLTNKTSTPFTTSENKPNVNTLIGKVKIFNTGLTKTFSNPIKRATSKAV
jgi:hypothetical protein